MLDETLISNPILDLHALFQLYVHQSFLQEINLVPVLNELVFYYYNDDFYLH